MYILLFVLVVCYLHVLNLHVLKFFFFNLYVFNLIVFNLDVCMQYVPFVCVCVFVISVRLSLNPIRKYF